MSICRWLRNSFPLVFPGAYKLFNNDGLASLMPPLAVFAASVERAAAAGLPARRFALLPVSSSRAAHITIDKTVLQELAKGTDLADMSLYDVVKPPASLAGKAKGKFEMGDSISTDGVAVTWRLVQPGVNKRERRELMDLDEANGVRQLGGEVAVDADVSSIDEILALAHIDANRVTATDPGRREYTGSVRALELDS